MNFADHLIDALATRRAPVAVQLSPRLSQLPRDIVKPRVTEDQLSPKQVGLALEEFCVHLIDRFASIVPAIVLPITSFARYGQPGMDAFFNVAMLARKRNLLVIGDGRGVHAPTQLGVSPFGRTNLLRHVWDVDAVATGLVRSWHELSPFVRVASETGKGVFLPDSCDAPPGPDTPRGWSELRAAASLAEWSVGRFGFSPLGVALSRPNQGRWPAVRRQLARSFLLAPAALDAQEDRQTLETLSDSQGLGVLLVAPPHLATCYLLAPWRQRFSPREWADAVELATAQWVAELSQAMPLAACLPV